MLAVRDVVPPGSLDISTGAATGGLHVVHLIVAVPHVHAGSGERFCDSLLLTTYVDTCTVELQRDTLRPVRGYYTVVQP